MRTDAAAAATPVPWTAPAAGDYRLKITLEMFTVPK